MLWSNVGCRWVGWALLPLLVACNQKAAPVESRAPEGAAEQAHVHEPAHPPLPKHLQLSAQVRSAVGVRSAPVETRALARTVALPGEVVADPDRSARVASPIAGRIERVSFREGSEVARGQVLATIRVPDLGKLRSTLASTLARAKAARANAARLEGLMRQSLAMEQTYLDALSQAEALEVEARAAQEQLTALGLGGAGSAPSLLTLRAPLAGVVVRRNAVVGQPVSADEVLADIVDLSEVWFLGRVFEKDLGRLALGAEAEVQLNAYPDQRFTGRVEYIGKQVDPVARTLTARIRLLGHADALRVGLFGTAYVSEPGHRESERGLVIPRNAITEVAGQPVAFVEQEDGHFELHELQLGESAGGSVQVVSGLREGERVVVEGVFSLKSMLLKHTLAEEE